MAVCVSGKDTSGVQRGKSLSVNNVGQPSARSVNLGLGAEVGWQSIDADWEASAAEIYLDKPVALYVGERDCITMLSNRTGYVCVCLCVCK